MNGKAIALRTSLWLPAVVAIAVVVIEKMFRFEPPHWSRWISVAIYALLGCVALANAHKVPGTRPVLVRIAGLLFLFIAILGTIYQLSSD
jgi:hypothetical protein